METNAKNFVCLLHDLVGEFQSDAHTPHIFVVLSLSLEEYLLTKPLTTSVRLGSALKHVTLLCDNEIRGCNYCQLFTSPLLTDNP